MLLRALFTFIFILFSLVALAQKLITVSGTVVDEKNNPLEKVGVTLVGLAGSAITDQQGRYTIQSRLSNFNVRFRLIGYQTKVLAFSETRGANVVRNVSLNPDIKDLKEINVRTKSTKLNHTVSIDAKELATLPSVSMNFEAILKTLPGVSTNNELSSQYSVRAGNFDENLIYVNDIEINRPVLIRNGQQEGLSFINPDLVSGAQFSAGGFGARYSDKLSSVLDVKYSKPDSNQYILTAGLMGISAAVKQQFKNSHLLFGYRRKDNRNVLNTQDQVGSYTPSFNDVQLLYQYNFNQKFSVNVLGNLNTGRFRLVPESRETLFGTLSTPMRLKIDYEGQEVDQYYTYGGAFTVNYHPSKNTSLKWINSYFEIVERERYDIDGNYIFEEIDDSNDAGFGTVKKNRGLGSYYSYARNSLSSVTKSTELKVDQNVGKHSFTYGLKFEQNKYSDDINEYNYIDSAGYILPANSNSFTFQDAIFTKNKLKINNASLYFQDAYSLSENMDLQAGLRFNYNDFSEEFLLSPRFSLLIKPSAYQLWRVNTGIYHQAPSYRSLRAADGQLFLSQKAQRSFNGSVGYDYIFNGLGTTLKFISEAYYKYADRMIPYTIDNVRIKYMPDQIAKGNTYGVDFSLGGEFVKDLMSFFRLSIMQANQDIVGDVEVQKGENGQAITTYPGYLKRPTDQRVNFSVFFQDRLFNSPTYKVHLNLLYGSRLPVGSPYSKTYSDKFSIPPYRRVDIGFSNDFLDPLNIKKSKFLSKYFDSIIAYAEVFNLLNIDNTVSYLWLKDVNNISYAIPNYLTGRQLNFKLILKIKH